MTEKYYLYNTVTHDVVNIPDDIDGVKWISLSEERYGDKYQYPAIYSMESHVVWDQSDELNKNGDWMMVAEATTPSDGGHSSEGSHGSDAAHGSDGSHGHVDLLILSGPTDDTPKKEQCRPRRHCPKFAHGRERP